MFNQRPEELMREIEVINQFSYLCITDSAQLQIKKATPFDSVLQVLKTIVLEGCQSREIKYQYAFKTTLVSEMKSLFRMGVLYKGMRVIVPKSMHSMMLTRVHSSHLGAEACQ